MFGLNACFNSLQKETREVKDGNGTLDFEETVILMHVYRPCLGVEDRKIGQIGSKSKEQAFFLGWGGRGGGEIKQPLKPPNVRPAAAVSRA